MNGYTYGTGAPAGVVPGVAPGRPAAVPPALWCAVAGFALAATLTLVGGLAALAGSGASAAGAYAVVPLLLGLVVALALPAVHVAIAVGLYRGSRVARTAGLVVGPVAALAVLTGGPGNAAMVLGALLGGVAAFPAALSPAVTRFLDGPWGSRPAAAPSITVARLVLAVFAGVAAASTVVGVAGGLIALVSATAAASSIGSAGGGELGDGIAAAVGLLGGVLGVMMIVVGVVWAGLAWFGFWARRALGARNRGARVAVTVVAGLIVLVELAALLAGPGQNPLTALTVATLLLNIALPLLLWIPADARAHFGEPPLPLIAHLRGELDRMVAQATTPAPAAFGGPFAAPTWRPTPAPFPAGPAHRPQYPDDAPTVTLAVTGRHARPASVCPRCATGTAPGDRHCARCGSPLAAV